MVNDIREELAKLRQRGRLRQFNPIVPKKGVFSEYNNLEMINLTSNDYLGLASDHEMLETFYNEWGGARSLEKYGLGSTSSRLLSGDNRISHELEDCLKTAYKRDAALLFNSGYHANIGILPALFGKKDLIVSDKLNHASIHDGMRLSRAEHIRYRHKDYDHLEQLLERKRDKYNRVVIVTESVFSMDGDEADLLRIVELKKKYECQLYIDEAHGVGLYGEKGLGKAEEYNVIADIDLLVGTFGKAFGSVGAYVVCDTDTYMYLVNHSRSLIFTTALPPVVLSWNVLSFTSVLTMKNRRSHLRKLAHRLRQDLNAHDLVTDGSTNIVPVMIGDNQRSVDMAVKMREEGYLIFPVRPPAVPEGTARFRLSLTANMGWEHLEGLAAKIVGAWSS
jgi:8-amino-7-oxononanoate synthase